MPARVNNCDQKRGREKEGGEKQEKRTGCAKWVTLTLLFLGGYSLCCLWQHGRHILQGVMGNNVDGNGDRFKTSSEYSAVGLISQPSVLDCSL